MFIGSHFLLLAFANLKNQRHINSTVIYSQFRFWGPAIPFGVHVGRGEISFAFAFESSSKWPFIVIFHLQSLSVFRFENVFFGSERNIDQSWSRRRAHHLIEPSIMDPHRSRSQMSTIRMSGGINQSPRICQCVDSTHFGNSSKSNSGLPSSVEKAITNFL